MDEGSAVDTTGSIAGHMHITGPGQFASRLITVTEAAKRPASRRVPRLAARGMTQLPHSGITLLPIPPWPELCSARAARGVVARMAWLWI